MSELRALQKQIEKLKGEIDRVAGDRPRILFRDFASAYLAEKSQRPTLRWSTKQLFAHQVASLLIPAFGDLALEEISAPKFLDWVCAKRQTMPEYRFFNSRKCLIEILRAAHERGHIEKLPKLENPDEPKDVGRVLDDKEVLAILRASRRPFRLIFYTFWQLGCRPREILQWEYAMLRQEHDGWWIDIPARISKTGRFRSITLPRRLMRILGHKRVSSPFVFPKRGNPGKAQTSYHAAWARACTIAGVKNAMAYDFRRTWITKRAVENKPLMEVARFLDTSPAMIQKTYYKSQAAVMRSLLE